MRVKSVSDTVRAFEGADCRRVEDATCEDGVTEVDAVPKWPCPPGAAGGGAPPLGGWVGGWVPVGAFAGPAWLSLTRFDDAETVVESTFASIRAPSDPMVTAAPVEAAGVAVELETEACEGVAVTLDSVEAAGVDVEVETETCEEVTLASDCVDTGGAETVAEAEVAGGAVLALASTLAPAAGALTEAVAEAEGVEEAETLTEAEAETSGACGSPGRPSACAGTAKARHATPHTTAQLTKRNLELCVTRSSVT